MPENTYDWLFDKGGLGRAQGAIDPAGEHFEGSAAEASVVRETGQNSGRRQRRRSGHDGVRTCPEGGLRNTGNEDTPTTFAATVEATEGRSGHER